MAGDRCESHPYFPGELPPEHLFLLFTLIAAAFIIVGAVLWVIARVSIHSKAPHVSFKAGAVSCC